MARDQYSKSQGGIARANYACIAVATESVVPPSPVSTCMYAYMHACTVRTNTYGPLLRGHTHALCTEIHAPAPWEPQVDRVQGIHNLAHAPL